MAKHSDNTFCSTGDCAKKAQIIKALGHPVRLKIISILGEGTFPVMALVQSVDEAQGSVSQHLAILRRCGIVSSVRQGAQVAYSLAEPLAKRIALELCK